MMTKGSYAGILLATKDLDGAFERLQASDADVVQEPSEQPYGVRDCAFRDPAGNPDPHERAPLSLPAIAAMTCTDGTVKEPARDVGGGRLVATVTDPDGNVLGLLQDR